MQNINRVVLSGNLTKDPELRPLPSGDSVCQLRLAVNSRRRNQAGEWQDQPNYFDVTVFGAQGATCERYLAKGRPVAVDGRLRWREFTRQDGSKGQAVDVLADTVQFLSAGDVSAANGEPASAAPTSAPTPTAPRERGDFDAPPSGQLATEDDIPF
jgi:single-strand DNA-binding protein